MSNYNPTFTVQYRDYSIARKERQKWHRKVERLKGKGMSPIEAVHKAGHMYTSPLITEVRPNPLSIELRIVFGFLWHMYTDCLLCADQEREKHYPSEKAAVSYEREAKEAVSYAYLLCHELFHVTSPHAPLHIHTEHGCNDETCPAWVRGMTETKNNVAEWYTPDC